MSHVSTRPWLIFVFCGLIFAGVDHADERHSLAGAWKYLPYNGEGDLASTSLDDSSWPTMQLPSNWFLLGSKEYPVNAKSRVGRLSSGDSGALGKVDTSEGLDY